MTSFMPKRTSERQEMLLVGDISWLSLVLNGIRIGSSTSNIFYNFFILRSLTSLNLIANPFNCNCHMAWFADWLRRWGNIFLIKNIFNSDENLCRRGLTSSGPRCVKPTHLKNKAIHSLATHEFRCTSKLWKYFSPEKRVDQLLTPIKQLTFASSVARQDFSHSQFSSIFVFQRSELLDILLKCPTWTWSVG